MTVNFDNTAAAYDAHRNGAQYHYSYGRHRQYGSLLQPRLYPRDDGGASYRLFFSPKPVPGIDDGPQSVDQILRDGFMDLPRWDPELAIIHDKRHTAWLGLDDILGQIRGRQEVYRKNMSDILWGECYAFNEVARTGWPASTKQWELYERKMQDLHAQARMERVSAWQDIARLRQLLPESIQLYLSAARKSDLLTDTEADLP